MIRSTLATIRDQMGNGESVVWCDSSQNAGTERPVVQSEIGSRVCPSVAEQSGGVDTAGEASRYSPCPACRITQDPHPLFRVKTEYTWVGGRRTVCGDDIYYRLFVKIRVAAGRG